MARVLNSIMTLESGLDKSDIISPIREEAPGDQTVIQGPRPTIGKQSTADLSEAGADALQAERIQKKVNKHKKKTS